MWLPGFPVAETAAASRGPRTLASISRRTRARQRPAGSQGSQPGRWQTFRPQKTINCFNPFTFIFLAYEVRRTKNSVLPLLTNEKTKGSGKVLENSSGTS